MAANYWLKLYHEMLDDPKVARLPDSSYRRFIECLLLAGEADNGGFLPPIEDMSWRLRVHETTLSQDMSRLAQAGIVELKAYEGVERWFVSKFADRQAPVTSTERVKRYRERNRKQKGNGCVTNRSIDIDIDEIREDKEKKSGRAAEKPTHPVWIIPEPLNTAEFEAAWIAWFKHRLEIDKYLTQTSGEMLLTQLSAWGSDRATAAIMHSIGKGWANVYEPNELQSANGRSQQAEPEPERIGGLY